MECTNRRRCSITYIYVIIRSKHVRSMVNWESSGLARYICLYSLCTHHHFYVTVRYSHEVVIVLATINTPTLAKWRATRINWSWNCMQLIISLDYTDYSVYTMMLIWSICKGMSSCLVGFLLGSCCQKLFGRRDITALIVITKIQNTNIQQIPYFSIFSVLFFNNFLLLFPYKKHTDL